MLSQILRTKIPLTLLSSFSYFSYTYLSKPKNFPGIFFDVDGVLMLGYTPIKRAKETIEKIRKYKIPLMVLTNKCGDTEIQKANEFTRILGLSKQNAFDPNEIVLCHTPMRSILQEYSTKDKNAFPLILGIGDIHTLMHHYGVKRYITSDEYATIFSSIIPYNCIVPVIHHKEKNKKIVEKRLGISINNNSTPLKINGIFQISNVLRQEIAIQLCSDLLISKDGIPGTIRDYMKEKQKVLYYLSNPDFLYMDKFILPRYATKSFVVSLQRLYEMQYKHRFIFTEFGKPTKLVFDFAREQCIRNAKGKRVKNFYMIGDYPEADVKGANEAGINSILVRTGVFKGKDNDENYPANYVCDDCYDALDYILKKEKLIKY